MEFNNLVRIVGDEPVFETSLLLAGNVDPADVRRQLSRWTLARFGVSPFQSTANEITEDVIGDGDVVEN